MDISRISDEYTVRRLGEGDVDEIYALSAGNPMFFRYCPPFVTRESILEDMAALPPRTTPEDKFYIGFFREGKLAAIMDLVFNYPDEKNAFIGLFMVDINLQGRGVGSAIMDGCLRFIGEQGCGKVSLAYAAGNPQSEAFWEKNGFAPTGREVCCGEYTAIMMEKKLG